MKSKSKAGFIAVLVIFLVVFGGVYLLSRGEDRAAGYRVAKVEKGPISSFVSTTGTLNAVITVQVGSQISGQIRELLADFNS